MKEQYYTIGEGFTSRKDIDVTMKWILVNIINKLNIPKSMLPDGEYTFSVSNVAKEMGIDRKTAWNKFQVLVLSNILTNVGEVETSNGTIVRYRVNTDNLALLMDGKLKLAKVSHDKNGVVSLLPKVGCLPITKPCLPITKGCLPITKGCLPITLSTQIEYSNPVSKESKQMAKSEFQIDMERETAGLKKGSTEYWNAIKKVQHWHTPVPMGTKGGQE